MIPKQKIREAIELLKAAADPVKILLFGSYARDEASQAASLMRELAR